MHRERERERGYTVWTNIPYYNHHHHYNHPLHLQNLHHFLPLLLLLRPHSLLHPKISRTFETWNERTKLHFTWNLLPSNGKSNIITWKFCSSFSKSSNFFMSVTKKLEVSFINNMEFRFNVKAVTKKTLLYKQRTGYQIVLMIHFLSNAIVVPV